MTGKREEQPNHLCADCLRHCKQEKTVVLVSCPRYLRRPFKVAKPLKQQLDLFGEPVKK